VGVTKVLKKELAVPAGAEFAAPRRRPKLLFLCQTLPYPPDGGVNIRSYHVLRLLAREYDVTALCFYRKAARPTSADVAWSLEALNKIAFVEAFPIPQEWSRPRFIADHVRSVLTGRPYTEYAYASAAFANRLDELLATQRFDLVHMDSLDLAHYLPRLEGLPIACTHHNVESELLARRGEVERSPVVRWYLRFQGKRTKAQEVKLCPQLALNLTVSERDQETLEELVPNLRVVTIPNGVDTHTFQPQTATQAGIVFVGGYDWFPNRDALEFFAEKILPIIRTRSPLNPDVFWVGRAPDAVRKQYADEHRIHLTGYVDDVRPWVGRAACFVVPLRTGGGTRLKILDAWAMGKAVVSTSVGCEGLTARDGSNILIRDDAEGFADAVVQVLSDTRLRTSLEQAARKTAQETYEWDVLAEKLCREYRGIVADQQESVECGSR
jgi:glycosyltransferase involved in cell wall biosynthesis